MNDETQSPESQSEEIPGAATAEPGAEDESQAGRSAADLAGDLRDFGERFAAALKAAASTPEAQELRGEIREGLGQVRDELDKVLEGLRANARRKADERRADVTEAKEAAEDAAASAEKRAAKIAGQVRVELAQVVRNLSAALDKVAGSMEPGAEAQTPSEVVVEAEIVEDGEAPAST